MMMFFKRWKKPSKKLELIKTVRVEASKGFKVSMYFRACIPNAPVYIGDVGGCFNEHLLLLSEGAYEASDIKVLRLLETSTDAVVVAELANKFEIKLGQFYSLLLKYSAGERDLFLENGDANVAYVRDGNGILMSVRAYWLGCHHVWGIDAFPTEEMEVWNAGRRFFSR